MANTYDSLNGLFTAIADAIRTKTGASEPITADKFPDEITAILSPEVWHDLTLI